MRELEGGAADFARALLVALNGLAPLAVALAVRTYATEQRAELRRPPCPRGLDDSVAKRAGCHSLMLRYVYTFVQRAAARDVGGYPPYCCIDRRNRWSISSPPVHRGRSPSPAPGRAGHDVLAVHIRVLPGSAMCFLCTSEVLDIARQFERDCTWCSSGARSRAYGAEAWSVTVVFRAALASRRRPRRAR